MVLNELIFSEFVVVSKPRELVAMVYGHVFPKIKDFFFYNKKN